ncbi:MAG: manganese efflux pump MntP family protein [Treponema sp.]|nr:manganese efflux pump MntP family protein [Treponema sp.]
MGITEITLIAIGLSMDAFAVSITLGLSLGSVKHKFIGFLIPGIYFGIFQALMPLMGFYTGSLFAVYIQNIDHWVAFALLALIGGKIIKDSFSNEEKEQDENPFKPAKMLLLAMATSIDAFAVGITFSLFRINIFFAILLIGLITFCISSAGVKIGSVFGTKYRSKAEFFGGAVLIILGVRILIEHLFFQGHY